MNMWLVKKCLRIAESLIAVAMLWACTSSNDDGGFAGGTTEDAGIIADLNVAGVTQKGPFVKGSAVTVQGIDCKTLELTDEHFEGKVKSDKGEFVVDSVTLSSTCAVFEVSGYYLNELTGKKSSEKLTLHALTNLKDRENVNINVLTELEYERVMNLVNDGGKSFADAKKQAEKEVLASFNVKGNVAEAEDLNIFEKGEGNAALLAVSVMVQASAIEAKLAERLDEYSAAISQNGSLDADAKKEFAKWATTAVASGKLDTIRKNIESWGYADDVPPFETYVKAVADGDSVTLSSASKNSGSGAGMTSSSRHSGLDPESSSSKDGSIYDAVKNTLTDSRDGQVYKTVTIGNQIWMAQNLNYKTEFSYCYNDSSKYCDKYGLLYTWAAAMDSAKTGCGDGKICSPTLPARGVCPDGWHLPSKEELAALYDGVGGGEPLMSKTEWSSNNGTDDYGFSVYPAGKYYPYSNLEKYTSLGNYTAFWSSSEQDALSAHILEFMGIPSGMSPYGKGTGLSVRCVKDSGSEAGMTSSSSSIPRNDVSSSSSWSGAIGSGDSVYFDWSLPKETYLNPKIKYDSIVDSRDGQVYKTVKIGKYNWMAENLNYTDSVKTPNLKENNWCYGDKLENCKVTGRLYSWSAVIAAGEHECGVGMSCKFRSRVQGICPSGWHLPDTSEWSELISAVNGRTFAGKMLKSQSGWLNEGNGLDAFGFSAIPGGSRVGYVNQVYEFEGWNAYFWSSTERDSALAYSMNMDTGLDGATYGSASKDYGFSVRCVENYVIASSSSSLSSSSRLAESSSSENFDWSVRKFEYLNLDKANYDEFKDKRDGKIYLTVEIGSHVWMAENLNYADSARTPSLKGKNWCYDNKEQRCDVAGRLYTWAAAIDSVALASNVGNPMTCGSKSPCALSGKVQGICPEGWHLPDTTEFRDLFNAAGGISELGAVLRSQTGWVESFMTPTDGLGFSAIPAGKRLADGNFRYVGSYTDFWSSTVRSQEDKVYSFIMSYSGLNENAGFATNVGKDEAISIRCVKD